MWWCHRCEVRWVSAAKSPCWICGEIAYVSRKRPTGQPVDGVITSDAEAASTFTEAFAL